ncbi:aldo/keto reductase, partial [Sphingopyxis sp.]|uniref:aldo/keto reductase n=1 Tax=Sphingopyxis sp. TaxID=1908224 RepID=UPI002EDB3F99
MQYRDLGDSGISVSTICLGSWLTYGAGVDDSAGRACVDAAFDVGINFIDTANIYGRGAAESFLGDVLKDRPRD